MFWIWGPLWRMRIFDQNISYYPTEIQRGSSREFFLHRTNKYKTQNMASRARRETFTTPQLVTTRRSILGLPAEGQPGKSGRNKKKIKLLHTLRRKRKNASNERCFRQSRASNTFLSEKLLKSIQSIQPIGNHWALLNIKMDLNTKND